MNSWIDKCLIYYYPQTYILRNPLKGTLIISLFVFGFTSLYKPFNVHATKVLSFEVTMAFYSFLSGSFMYLVVRTLKAVKYFSKEKEWTFFKEIISVLIILFALGLAIYFLGFLIETESSANRWKISTFLNSIGSAFLIGIIPASFFTAINYRYLFSPVISHNEGKKGTSALEDLPAEDLIRINSQLKKEELSFYPGEFMYAESDGNYVVFYLKRNSFVKKEIIRNSINSIEKQLSHIPYFFRTHRAFIVNLKKVRTKQGNTLGYLLKLTDIDLKIPVSRNNTGKFNNLFDQYHSC
jgi:LytTr DNA-binding domain